QAGAHEGGEDDQPTIAAGAEELEDVVRIDDFEQQRLQADERQDGSGQVGVGTADESGTRTCTRLGYWILQFILVGHGPLPIKIPRVCPRDELSVGGWWNATPFSFYPNRREPARKGSASARIRFQKPHNPLR